MKRLLKLGIFSVVPFLILAPTLTKAFNSAAHVYIAEQVFPDCSRKIDLRYGSVAPDLALLMPWESVYEDTHSIDLGPYAWPWSPAQQAFAKGWWTHNWLAGADYYADEYISLKTDDLLTDELLKYLDDIGIPEDKYGLLAHFAIEKAVDLLLKDEYPEIALNLLNAVLLRSWQDRFLLVKVFVWKYDRTDWLTLVETELAFRTLIGRYAVALALSSPLDVTPLVELGKQLASEMYDIDISVEDLAVILNAAIAVCKDDYYKEAIERAINDLKSESGKSKGYSNGNIN